MTINGVKITPDPPVKNSKLTGNANITTSKFYTVHGFSVEKLCLEIIILWVVKFDGLILQPPCMVSLNRLVYHY